MHTRARVVAIHVKSVCSQAGGKRERGRKGNIRTRFVNPVISGCDAEFVAADKLQTLERAEKRDGDGR